MSRSKSLPKSRRRHNHRLMRASCGVATLTALMVAVLTLAANVKWH